MVNLDFDRNFVEEWIERANTNEGSYITQFFCYFIALNYLYNAFNYQFLHHNGSGKTERMMLKNLIRFYHRRSEGLNWNSPYDLLDDNSELLRVARSETSNNNNHSSYYQKLLDKKDIVELFQNIYTVRCNLFHGSKSMKSSRNSSLVKDSNLVLKDFLGKMISE